MRVLTRIGRHLHWWTAALVATAFTLAWVMTALPISALLVKFLAYQVHKSIGLIVAGLTVMRLWLAWRTGARTRGVRAVLFGLLLVVPCLGYLSAASSPTAVPTLFLLLVSVPHIIAPDAAIYAVVRPVHEWMAIGLVGLAAWHAWEMRRLVFRRSARATAQP